MFHRVRHVFKPAEFTLTIFTKPRVRGKIMLLASLPPVFAYTK
jgi:hypothetical protein